MDNPVVNPREPLPGQPPAPAQQAQRQAPPPMPSGQAVDEGTSDPEILQADVTAKLEHIEAAVAQLQDEVLGNREMPPDAGTETEESGFSADVIPDMGTLHTWRVITQNHPSDATKRQWACVNNDGANVGTDLSGKVINQKGTALTSVTSAWVDYTISAGVSGWLKITMALSNDTVTYATIETTDPTASAAPFDPTASIFVIPLFQIDADGTVHEYQFSDIDLQQVHNGITVATFNVTAVPTKSNPPPGFPVLTFVNWNVSFKYGHIVIFTPQADVAITIC